MSNDKEDKKPSLEHVPITLTWKISASIETQPSKIGSIKNKIKSCLKKGDPADNSPSVKKILDDVPGIARPGELVAIMGASGAGKTTLLNILNFRNRGKLKIKGDVKLNGKVADWELITRHSGYVQQEDLFMSTLTVKEHLNFMAEMNMGKNFTKAERTKRVEEVIIQMNLIKSQDTWIGNGDQVKGISGGEKRRLAFASEILTNPSLLFADEPTSGLDSFMAESIIDSMCQLAFDQGKTVITTIHQPSSQIFEKFNTLCLLAEGRLTYMGPASDAIKHFASLGYPVPNLSNPADHYINTLAIEPNNRDDCLARVKKINDFLQEGPIRQQLEADIKTQEEAAAGRLDEKPKFKYNASYFNQVKSLLRRTFVTDLRNPLATRVLLAQSIVISLFIGLIFLQLEEDERGVQNRLGVIFITLMQTNFGYIFAVVNSFPHELPLVYRETKNRTYSLFPYFIVRTLAPTPKLIMFPFILTTIIYWLSALNNDAGVYIQVVLIFVLNTQVAVSYATLVSVVAGNIDSALALVVPILMPLLIFSGFFLNNDSTPVYFLWIKYISWMFYCNESINILVWSNTGTIPCSTAMENSTCAGRNCFDDGYAVLDFLSFNEDNLTRNILIMILMFFLFRIASFIALRIRVNKS